MPTAPKSPTTRPPLDSGSRGEAQIGSVRAFAIFVVAAWALTIVIVVIKAGMHIDRHSVIPTYLGAGLHWLKGEALYKGGVGFVYSPLVAGFFSPVAHIPRGIGSVLWVAVNIAVYVSAIAWCLAARLFPRDGKIAYPLLFLALLPLSIGNFSNGQVNPLVIGLLLAGVVAVRQRRMSVAALCIALSVYFKIYPIAMGLVLMVAYPKEFSWRFLLALVALFGLTFLLQKPAYVWSQYQLWIQTRTADNRLQYGIDIAPRDLWMILKTLHVPIGERAYMAFQALSGAAIAVIALLGRFRFRWSEERLLIGVFCFVDCWMLLCGPATESATYVMLAPAIAFALVQLPEVRFPAWMRTVLIAAYVVFLTGLGINSFFHLKKTRYIMSIQPFGALLFTTFAVAWIFKDHLWRQPREAALVKDL